MSHMERSIPHIIRPVLNRNIETTWALTCSESKYCRAQIELLSAYERAGQLINNDAAARASRTMSHFQARMRG